MTLRRKVNKTLKILIQCFNTKQIHLIKASKMNNNQIKNLQKAAAIINKNFKENKKKIIQKSTFLFKIINNTNNLKMI